MDSGRGQEIVCLRVKSYKICEEGVGKEDDFLELMLVLNQKSLLLVFNQNISGFSQTCLFFFSTQNLYQEKGSFLPFCLSVQREGETMLMELPDFQKSQTKRHCTWQTTQHLNCEAGVFQKHWASWICPLWTCTEHALMKSTAHAPESGDIPCIVLAVVWRSFQRSSKVQSLRCSFAKISVSPVLSALR